ncbi:helix-turn-helix domain-containing protein [Kutzneria chonburiensis]|uniref:Helix-turn-helix domain-containing protein n=1 Tax=Kutzneria chonburiensis TaxID=1483604 RepID=A0ABV6MSL6_9PSEU|nr:helix-turn-helix domain-containing protein [Kutzneria chonburiensis]
MSQEMYSVEQVADLLGLHVRTVRGYVRDGRLKAVRIGKQYRIAQADLDAFTGAESQVRRTRHVEVSTIVEIDAISREDASRIAMGAVGAANTRGYEAQPLRIETAYDEVRGRLKLIILGDLTTTAELLRWIALLAEGES